MDHEIWLEPRRRRLFTARETAVILAISLAITTGLMPFIG